MPLPSKRDPEQLRVALREALSEHFDGPIDIGPVAAPPTTGMSSETLLFDLIREDGSQPLVARLRPAMDDLPVFPEYDLSKQARIMRIVGEHTDVPVPEILIEEPDEGVLGAPFIVMSRVEGEALPDMMPYTLGGSFLDDFSPDERSEFRSVFMSVLARLHAIDPADVDLSFIAPVDGDALGRQLAAQRAYYEWAREGTDLPLIVRGLDWLDAHRPHDPGPTRLNWGDSRPGNLLVTGLIPTAALDWEMVDLGPPGVDVGWALFMHQFFQHIAEKYELPGFPDFFEPAAAHDDYVAAGGAVIEDLDWYIVYASVRMASIIMRTSLRGIAYGEQERVDDPEDLVIHRALLEAQLNG